MVILWLSSWSYLITRKLVWSLSSSGTITASLPHPKQSCMLLPCIQESKYPWLLWYQIPFADLAWRESRVKVFFSIGFCHLEPCSSFWVLVISYSSEISWFAESWKHTRVQVPIFCQKPPMCRGRNGVSGCVIRLREWTCRAAGAAFIRWRGLNRDPLAP